MRVFVTRDVRHGKIIHFLHSMMRVNLRQIPYLFNVFACDTFCRSYVDDGFC